MKSVTLLIYLIAVTAAASLPEQSSPSKKVEFTPKAKFVLRKASLRIISELCFGDDVMPEIYNTICIKAINNQFKMKSPYAAVSAMGSNCIDCEVADPICWDACPQ